MVNKLKIPSENLMIVGNNFYKGYRAEYRERLRQGEFLIVELLSTGQRTHIPIENIVFIMNDNRLVKYVLDQNGGLKLVDYETGRMPVDLSTIPEKKSSSEKFSPVEEDVDMEDSDKKTKNIEDEDEDLMTNKEYLNSFQDIQTTNRETIKIEYNPISKNLEIIFNLLGFEMDNTSINHHSRYLEDILKNPFFKNITFTEDLYKTYSLAYVFIYINQMGMGYPIPKPGCRLTPNDDPSFITCVALQSNFIKANPSDFSIEDQITHLLISMGSKLVPPPEDLGLTSKFSLLNFRKSQQKRSAPVIKTRNIKPKLMSNFPLMAKSTLLQTELKTKEYIYEKIRNRIDEEENLTVKSVLENFKNNFDSYIKGAAFIRINNNPELMESRIIMPFVKEFKQRLELEEKKFYDKPLRQTIKNSKRIGKRKTDNIKDLILPRMNAGIKRILQKPDLTRIEKNALEYVLRNIEEIVKYDSNKIQSLKLDLLTANEEKTELINSVLTYIDHYKKLSRALEQKSKDIKLERERQELKNKLILRKFEQMNL